MIVSEVAFTGFMPAPAGTFRNYTLPARGIVVVHGPNGSGKSTLIEAVAAALWGESVRGAPAWREGEAGEVNVTLSDRSIARRRSAHGKVKLSWTEPGAAASPVFDTATKAQAALDRLIPAFDVWRRSAVFSSQDAMHFTLARDAERKRMLEVMLGLERFDAASTRCRAALRAAVAEREAARNAEETVTNALAREEQALDALDELAPPVDRATLQAATEAEDVARAAVHAVLDALHAVEDLRSAAIDADRVASAGLDRAQREHQRLAAGACTACSQPLPQDAVLAATRVLARAQATCESARTAAAAELAQCRARAEELRAEHTEAEGKRQAATLACVALQSAAAQHARAASQRQTIAASIAYHTVGLASAKLAAVATAQRAAVLTEADRVLGLSGVRALMLGRALSAIEAVANTWLGRIAGWGMRLELKPYAEKAGGGTKDSIALEVHGAAGGRGYKGASGGQRRRIDVALLLALGEVSAAAHGEAVGTLFFDEVFDALDQDGIDAVVDVLEELAADRCCVVITHNDALRARINPARLAAVIDTGAP